MAKCTDPVSEMRIREGIDVVFENEGRSQIRRERETEKGAIGEGGGQRRMKMGGNDKETRDCVSICMHTAKRSGKRMLE